MFFTWLFEKCLFFSKQLAWSSFSWNFHDSSITNVLLFSSLSFSLKSHWFYNNFFPTFLLSWLCFEKDWCSQIPAVDFLCCQLVVVTLRELAHFFLLSRLLSLSNFSRFNFTYYFRLKLGNFLGFSTNLDFYSIVENF